MSGTLAALGLSKTTKAIKPKAQDLSDIQVDIHLIESDPDQPRRKFDESALSELAESIRVNGVVQPITVRKHPNDPNKLIIVAGERRYRASIMADQKTIPAVIKADSSLVDQMIENLQRVDLNAVETAAAVRVMSNEMAASAIAKSLSKTPAWVSKMLKISKMPDILTNLYELGRISDSLDTLYEASMMLEKHGIESTVWLNSFKDKSDVITGKMIRDFIKATDAKKLPPPPEKAEVTQAREQKQADKAHDKAADAFLKGAGSDDDRDVDTIDMFDNEPSDDSAQPSNQPAVTTPAAPAPREPAPTVQAEPSVSHAVGKSAVEPVAVDQDEVDEPVSTGKRYALVFDLEQESEQEAALELIKDFLDDAFKGDVRIAAIP